MDSLRSSSVKSSIYPSASASTTMMAVCKIFLPLCVLLFVVLLHVVAVLILFLVILLRVLSVEAVLSNFVLPIFEGELNINKSSYFSSLDSIFSSFSKVNDKISFILTSILFLFTTSKSLFSKNRKPSEQYVGRI